MAIPNAGGQAGEHSKAMVACGRDPDRCSTRCLVILFFVVISARFLRCGIIAFHSNMDTVYNCSTITMRWLRNRHFVVRTL